MTSVVLKGSCSPDDKENFMAIHQPGCIHFNIFVQILLLLTAVGGAQSAELFDKRHSVTLLSDAELKLPIKRQEPEANQSKQTMM